MTLEIDSNVPWGDAGSSRSPFLNYLFGEFPKLHIGDSFKVNQVKLQNLAESTARTIITPKGLATRVCWAYHRWAKANGNTTRAKYRRDGSTDYRVFIVRRVTQPDANAAQGDLPNV